MSDLPNNALISTQRVNDASSIFLEFLSYKNPKWKTILQSVRRKCHRFLVISSITEPDRIQDVSVSGTRGRKRTVANGCERVMGGVRACYVTRSTEVTSWKNWSDLGAGNSRVLFSLLSFFLLPRIPPPLVSRFSSSSVRL